MLIKQNSKFRSLKKRKNRPIFKNCGKSPYFAKICESERGKKWREARFYRGFSLKKVPLKSTNFRENRTKNGDFRRKTKKMRLWMEKNQCRMKKMSSFISSPASVFGFSIPLLFASISLSLEIICIVFMPE